MEVTRLKSGYRITLSDGEMDVLKTFVDQGLLEVESNGGISEDNNWGLTRSGMNAFVKGRFSRRRPHPLAADVDRRANNI